jgi:hypothetical protein
MLTAGVVKAALGSLSTRALADVVPASVHALATDFFKAMVAAHSKVSLVALTLLALAVVGMSLGAPIITCGSRSLDDNRGGCTDRRRGRFWP